MSLEQAILANTEAVNRLFAVLSQQGASVQQAAAAVAQAPVVQQAAAPAMPASPFGTTAAAPAPSFAPPAPAAPAGAPFADQAGLFAYTTQAYQAMGAEKGARIQQILVSAGIQNLNDLKPEHYGAFYQHVEALKASA